MSSSVSPRPPSFSHNVDGTLDEIFADAKHVHIEQMDDSAWWMGITLADGNELHVNFWTPRTRIRVNYNVEGAGEPEGGEFGTGIMVPDHPQVKRHV